MAAFFYLSKFLSHVCTLIYVYGYEYMIFLAEKKKLPPLVQIATIFVIFFISCPTVWIAHGYFGF